MIRFTKPSPAKLDQYLAAQSALDFTYAEVGATKGAMPTKYQTHRVRTQLGSGEQVFRAAKAAIQHWAPFATSWTALYPSDARVEEGRNVAALAHVLGLWSVNACRIVYTIDQPDCYGFGYGTLPGHTESGEERFQVEWVEDGSVWYSVNAFFRPSQLFARLAWPMLRRKVNQFREDSAAAMRCAVTQ